MNEPSVVQPERNHVKLLATLRSLGMMLTTIVGTTAAVVFALDRLIDEKIDAHAKIPHGTAASIETVSGILERVARAETRLQNGIDKNTGTLTDNQKTLSQLRATMVRMETLIEERVPHGSR